LVIEGIQTRKKERTFEKRIGGSKIMGEIPWDTRGYAGEIRSRDTHERYAGETRTRDTQERENAKGGGINENKNEINK
jgi:hypothetical protein